LCIHGIGVSEGVTLLKFEGALSEEDQEQPRNQPPKEFPKTSYLSARTTALLSFLKTSPGGC
jgi:hypothetical protein